MNKDGEAMIIFVAGIHGVGKTYLSVPAAQRLGILHATASQLIREERGMQSWGQNKLVSEVDENQSALISAVGKIKASQQSLLLDGHFVLRGDQEGYIPIEEEAFRDLKIDAVLLIETTSEAISNRLTARGDYSWSVTALTSFAANERAHATKVSSSIGLPLLVLSSPSQNQFEEAVERILRS
jgi:adenylate kinase